MHCVCMISAYLCICIFAYLFRCVHCVFFRCIHCVWPIIPGTNVCLASSPHSRRLCSLYWGTLQVFPKWCCTWLPFTNIISTFPLYFIFVSIWISLLSVKFPSQESCYSPLLPLLGCCLPWRSCCCLDHGLSSIVVSLQMMTFMTLTIQTLIFNIFPFINSPEQKYPQN